MSEIVDDLKTKVVFEVEIPKSLERTDSVMDYKRSRIINKAVKSLYDYVMAKYFHDKNTPLEDSDLGELTLDNGVKVSWRTNE